LVFTVQGRDAQGQNLYAQSEGVKVQDLSVAPAAAASAPPAATGGTGPAPSARKVISLGTQPAVVVNEPASAIVLTQNATTQSWQMTLDGKTETLQGVTRIATQDYVIGLDLEAASGQAYRIYRAIFDRSPDLEGLGYWIGRMDAGLSVEELAARFIDSDEYRSLYGTGLSPEAFLKRVYENVLGRAPDPAGLAWWVNQMQTNPDKTPAKVLADFSESAENKTGTAAELAQGVKYIAFGSKPAQPTAQDQLLALSPSVNEGGTARFEFKPAQPIAGATYSYTIQGVSAEDLVSGSLTGSVVINEQGVGEIAIALLADKTTEGNELLGIRLGDLSADLTVYDTSLTVRVVGLVPGGG
jgi:hypothetical protein